MVEDTVRFLADNKKVVNDLRRLRHRVSRIGSAVYNLLITTRDSDGDVGKEFTSTGFETLHELVTSNFRRAQEAVRVLEEYSRLLSRDAVSDLQRIRFRLYSLEKQVVKLININKVKPRRRKKSKVI